MLTRRAFMSGASALVASAALWGCTDRSGSAAGAESIDGENQEAPMTNAQPTPGTGGNIYVPFDKRTGESSVVFFTRDLTAAGLMKAYDAVASVLEGKVAVKLHTGEEHGPNIIPRPWVKNLMEQRLPNGTIVETNTYYEGDRDTTEKHRATIEANGWTFADVDIMDEFGTAELPVAGGKWFTEMTVGEHLLNYDSFLALTHFKGHTMGGFGGSNKNIGIGCADAHIGKKAIHTAEGSSDMWSIAEEELMERISESTKATADYFAGKIAYVNVMRNMSVSCDCEGRAAQPVVTPDVGILASLDILALDQACVDLVYALPEESHKALVERIETRHGLRQLSYMKELGMGNDRYTLIDLDNGGCEITQAEAVAHAKPTWEDDGQGAYE
ncbi:DUF362 domain-containing protein [Slackia heliotrinireducens]|nr:DUF362 domain-containing protein [Slackia heliotrinireducens]